MKYTNLQSKTTKMSKKFIENGCRIKIALQIFLRLKYKMLVEKNTYFLIQEFFKRKMLVMNVCVYAIFISCNIDHVLCKNLRAKHNTEFIVVYSSFFLTLKKMLCYVLWEIINYK